MKFIFDFDDVLFNNTKQFKEHMYACLEKAGVPRSTAEKYYKEVRMNQFCLKQIIINFSLKEDLYEKILKENNNFKNQKLINLVKKLGKENCYIVTRGDEKLQREKIRSIGIDSLFSEIIVVSETKKEAVEKICVKHKNEEIIFVDDKSEHFKDLDFKKYPNLKTILYDEQGFEKIISILSLS